jgi:hypothetical protein
LSAEAVIFLKPVGVNCLSGPLIGVLLLATIIMSLMVVMVNRLVWQPMFRLDEELDSSEQLSTGAPCSPQRTWAENDFSSNAFTRGHTEE